MLFLPFRIYRNLKGLVKAEDQREILMFSNQHEEHLSLKLIRIYNRDKLIKMDSLLKGNFLFLNMNKQIDHRREVDLKVNQERHLV